MPSSSEKSSSLPVEPGVVSPDASSSCWVSQDSSPVVPQSASLADEVVWQLSSDETRRWHRDPSFRQLKEAEITRTVEPQCRPGVAVVRVDVRGTNGDGANYRVNGDGAMWSGWYFMVRLRAAAKPTTEDRAAGASFPVEPTSTGDARDLAQQHADVATRALMNMVKHSRRLRDSVQEWERVGRIARAALTSLVDALLVDMPASRRDDIRQGEEALRELRTLLPDERDGVEASLAAAATAVPRTSLLNPELMVKREGVVAYTTLREFLDQNPDDEHARAAALGLEPGDSVTLAGVHRSTPLTLTRKAA